MLNFSQNFSSDMKFADFSEHIGKGYGKKLFQSIIDELYKFGFWDIFLWVLEDNIRVRTFYEKAGFLCGDKFMDVYYFTQRRY